MNSVWKISVPVTQPTGRARIKTKKEGENLAKIHPTRSKIINENCYLEWQFKYDVLTNSEQKSAYPDLTFVGSNGKTKNLFEFSEILYNFYKEQIISKNELENIRDFLSDNSEFIEDKLVVKYQMEQGISLAGFDFTHKSIIFPVYRIELSDGWFAEITLKEKQKAVGYQSMLYLCCPLSKLSEDLVGRKANKNEVLDILFSEDKKDFILTLLKLLGILSPSHKQDMISIINLIIG